MSGNLRVMGVTSPEELSDILRRLGPLALIREKRRVIASDASHYWFEQDRGSTCLQCNGFKLPGKLATDKCPFPKDW